MFVTGTNVAWREYIYGLEAGQKSHQILLTVANAGARDHDKANTHVFLSRFGVKSHGMWSWDPGAHHNTDNKQGNEKIWFNSKLQLVVSQI